MDLREIINADNVADKLDADKLNRIGSDVLRDFEIDRAARGEKDQRLEEAGRIARQVIEEKNYPYPKSSNVKYPLLTKAVVEFNARVSPLILNNGKAVKIKSYGKKDDLVVEDGEFKVSPETGRLETEQDAGQNRARKVQDLLNWVIVETGSWEEDKDRLTLVYALAGFAATKNYFDYAAGVPRSELVLPTDLYWEEGKTFDKATRKTQLIKMSHNEIIEKMRMKEFREVESLLSEDRRDEDVGLLECHTLLDLDDDGYKEPYIVTLTEDGGEVLRIVPRFKKVLAAPGKVIKIEPKEYFVFYQFIPCPDGSVYPLGLCDLLLSMNSCIDTNINQLIDAGTVANLPGGFVSGNIRIRGGQQAFTPGEFKKIDNAGIDISKAIVPLPVKEPSATLFNLLGVLVDSGKDLAMLSDVLQGEINPNVPATTVLAMIEQSLSGFKAILKRLQRSLKQEFDIFYRLAAENLLRIKEQYGNVPVVREVSLEDFAEDYQVVPVSDEYYSTSLEKAKRAEFFMSLAMSGNPFINPLEATRRSLALLNIDDWQELIAKPQPAQPDPAAMLQASLAQAQIRRLDVQNQIDLIKASLEKMRTDSDVGNKALEVQSENLKRGAEAISALANAESKEAGINNPAYAAQAKDISLFNNRQAKENIDEQIRLGNAQPVHGQGLGGV